VFETSLEPVVADIHPAKAYDAPLPWNIDTRFAQWSEFPCVLRDIAVWVPNTVSSDDVETVLRTHAGPLLARVDLFDTFEKDGRTSYAWHLVFQADDRTLTDEEVTQHMDNITAALHKQNGWEVR